MNLLYPRIPRGRIGTLIAVAARGALIAGLYGIVHDQLTYGISPEYFTQLKFRQFAWANLGWPPRVFAGVIGFLATWWVGMFAGWLIGRVTVARAEPATMHRLATWGFVVMLGCALAAGLGAYAYGLTQQPDPETSALADFAVVCGATDITAFVRVAYIHNAGYLGGLIGLIAAVARARWLTRSGSPLEFRLVC